MIAGMKEVSKGAFYAAINPLDVVPHNARPLGNGRYETIFKLRYGQVIGAAVTHPDKHGCWDYYLV